MESKSKNPKDIKVGVTHGMRGYYAVLYETYEDGFSEPIHTGIGSYATAEEAKIEARSWAKDEQIPVDF